MFQCLTSAVFSLCFQTQIILLVQLSSCSDICCFTCHICNLAERIFKLLIFYKAFYKRKVVLLTYFIVVYTVFELYCVYF